MHLAKKQLWEAPKLGRLDVEHTATHKKLGNEEKEKGGPAHS